LNCTFVDHLIISIFRLIQDGQNKKDQRIELLSGASHPTPTHFCKITIKLKMKKKDQDFELVLKEGFEQKNAKNLEQKA